MPHRLLLLLAPLCALTLFGSPAAAGNRQPVGQRQTQSAKTATASEAMHLKNDVKQQRQATWKWQKVALRAPTHASYIEDRTASVPLLKWTLHLWQHRAAVARRNATNPQHLAMWLCIHSHEASWTDKASHNPHYGGLQMGEWFMQTYAGSLLAKLGTANNWPMWQQIWVAERAYTREHHSRSWLFGQWPATAPPCVNI